VTEHAVRMQGISKSFSGVEVLHKVDFELEKGEIHALVGSNGAGKSTLIKILSGALGKDEGTIQVFGREVQIRNPSDAKALGIQTVYQELALISNFTIAQNIFLGKEQAKYGFVNDEHMRRSAQRIVKELNFAVDVNKKASDVSIGVKIMTEICRCLSEEQKIIILDEPSTVMSLEELKNFKGFIRSLREKGLSIIYISHRIAEIFELCDRVTILKDGSKVATLKVAETTHEELVRLMIGKSMKEYLEKQRATDKHENPEVISLEHVSNDTLKDITFSVKKGEIIGVTGLLGSGKTELARVMFGADAVSEGVIRIAGREVKLRHPNEAKKHSIGYVPEDRKIHGLLQGLSVKENIAISNLARLRTARVFVDSRKERRFVPDLVKRFNVICESIDRKISSLSGGNQQKAVLSKWLGGEPQLLLLDEPTRGIDVGAKQEVYAFIRDIAGQGVSVVIFSSEIDEILALSDRIIVLSKGRISGISSDYDEEAILLKSTGGN